MNIPLKGLIMNVPLRGWAIGQSKYVRSLSRRVHDGRIMEAEEYDTMSMGVRIMEA